MLDSGEEMDGKKHLSGIEVCEVLAELIPNEKKIAFPQS